MTGSDDRTKAPERTTLVISALVLATMISVLLWSTTTTASRPPAISVEPHFDHVRVIGDRYYLPITIANNGDLTAQDVTISGEVETGQGQAETADITIAFLAGGEVEEAQLVFTSEPIKENLTVGVTSFLSP